MFSSLTLFSSVTFRPKKRNKAGHMATSVACRWAGAIIEVSEAFGQEQKGQKPHLRQKSKV